MRFDIPARRIVLLLVALSALTASAPAAAACGPGQVYTETNDPAGNQLLVFRAKANGLLTQTQAVGAGGLGIGEHIPSGGSVTVSADGCRVAAVNVASGAFAVFDVSPAGRVSFAGSAASGGAHAISLAIRGSLIAVLSTNEGGPTVIQTFTVAGHRVTPVPGSLQAVGPGVIDGGQIAFSARGRYLVVSTRKSQSIATFRVDAGVPTPAESLPLTSGDWPYGFAIDARNHVVLSAFSLSTAGGSYSSYQLTQAGGITTVTASATDSSKGACWVAMLPDGAYAWGSSADLPALVTMSVSKTGAIAITAAADTGGVSIRDIAIAPSGRFLYALQPDGKDIRVYRVGAKGALTLVGTVPTPASASATGGIAAA